MERRGGAPYCCDGHRLRTVSGTFKGRSSSSVSLDHPEKLAFQLAQDSGSRSLYVTLPL